tara:strand:+ start:272 stop:889 length:618 start_codon:yes stop_codon:yes gene_type:complete
VSKEAVIADKQQSLAPLAKPSENPLDETQAEMFPLEQQLEQTKSILAAYKTKGESKFSGAILERDKAKVELMLELISDPQVSHHDIARLMRVSRNTVAALERRADADGRLASYRHRALEKTRYIHRLTGDRFIEALEKGQIPADKIMIAWGIASDHLLKFEGMPTVIHANARVEPTADEMDEIVKNLKAELAEKQVNSIEVETNE